MKSNTKTKFILTILTLALLLTISIAAVSAQTAPTYKTLVAGKVYNSPNFETAGPVADANINATCNGYSETTTSLADGTYSVEFSPDKGCIDTIVNVTAEKDGISNSGTGNIQNYTSQFNLYLGVVNIALIPEFGLMIGALTLASAIGIFFFVRRK